MLGGLGTPFLSQPYKINVAFNILADEETDVQSSVTFWRLQTGSGGAEGEAALHQVPLASLPRAEAKGQGQDSC